MKTLRRKQLWWILKIVVSLLTILIVTQVFFMFFNHQILQKWYLTHQDPTVMKLIKRVEWPINTLDRFLKDLNPLMRESIPITGVNIPEFNVILSNKDIQALTTTFQLARENTYMYDRFNQWRKVQVQVDGKKLSAKIKYYWQDTPNFMNTKKSFTLKFDDSYKTMKRIKFVLFEESVWINRMYAYEQARKTWLISIDNFVGKLSFNGVNQGYYFIEEHIDENVLEKSGYSNNVIVKVWDAFNTFWESHNTRHSFTPANFEVLTDNPLLEKQISYAFWVFINAIEQKDFELIQKYIDIDYRARFEALRNLIGDKHMIKGNNMKFFYNLANSKFYPIFRSEWNFESHQRVSFKTYENLEYGSYYEDAYQTVQWWNITAILNSNDMFRNLKYNYLYSMIQNTKSIELYSILQDRYDTIITRDVTNNYGYNYYHRDLKRGQEILKTNVWLIHKYLSFSRIFVNAEINHDTDTITITVSPDSMAPLTINQMSIGYSWWTTTGSLTLTTLSGNQLQKSMYYDKSHIHLTPSLSSELFNHHLDEKMNISRAEYEYVFEFPNSIIDLTTITIQATNTLTGKPLEDHVIETNISSVQKSSWLPRNISELLEYGFTANQDNQTITLTAESYLVTENIIVPAWYTLIIEAWVQMRIDPWISFISYSPIDIRGNEQNRVTISSSASNLPYGVFWYIGDSTKTTTIKYLDISWGSEVLINGLFVSGGFSLYFTDVIMDHVKISGHSADDGLNIKYGNVHVTNTLFNSNFADQFDCDYCTGEISDSTFTTDKINSDGDWLDVSGSDLLVKNNSFIGFGDKWMSIGEGTSVNLIGNSFIDNNIWIAIKDWSHATLGSAIFTDNKIDISMYIKKDIFSSPILLADESQIQSLIVETDTLSLIKYK